MNQEIQATPVVAVKYDAGGSQPKQTFIIDNSGDQLFTTIYPNTNKQTVLLLHGGPGFPDDLVEVVAVLKDHFQVVTFHQRGTGASPSPGESWSRSSLEGQPSTPCAKGRRSGIGGSAAVGIDI